MAASAPSVMVLLASLVSVCTAAHDPFTCSEHPMEIIPRVYLEPAHHVMKREADQPIRIMPFYDDTVTDSLEFEIRTRIKARKSSHNDIMPRLLTFISQTLSVRPTGVPILLDRRCTTDSLFLPGEPPLRVCADQCSATTMCGTVQVPLDHLKACTECNGNFPNCTTSSSSGPGVSGADYVLYVSTDRRFCNETIIAGACQTEASLDRPISGYINFCPDALANESNDFILIVAKHEILHALGFTRFLFALWRNPDGTPRTSRDLNGLPPYNTELQQFQWSDATIRTEQRERLVVPDVRVNHTVYLMVTERVVEEARIHYGCPSLDGVELENQGGRRTMLSHWEKRIFGNEAMTGVITFGPVFSRITFAAFEDSGWYQVNYDNAEELLWGRGAGCVLPTASCREYILSQQASNKPITPFCDRPIIDPVRRGCTIDRDAISVCNLIEFDSNLPPEYQFFSRGRNFGGNVEVTDYCPFQLTFTNGEGTACADPSNQPAETSNRFILGETYSSTSRCFDHGRRWRFSSFVGSIDSKVDIWGSGCYQYECSPENGVTVSVLGRRHVCQFDGQELQISVPLPVGNLTGSIICPACADICHDDLASCPSPTIADPTPTTESPTPTVTMSTTEIPTPTVTTTTTESPTPPATTTATESPTPAVTTTTTESPTPTVTTTTTESPTPAVTTTTTESPTPAVTTTTTESPTPAVTTTTTESPTPAVTMNTTESPTGEATDDQSAAHSLLASLLFTLTMTTLTLGHIIL